MLGPDPISVRGAKRQTHDSLDPVLRRYLEKEFLGGQVAASLAPAGGEPRRMPNQAETAATKANAGIWAAVKRALFRDPRRTRLTTVPSRI